MVNNVVLTGRLTADPDFKVTQNGKEMVSFTIAINRNFKNSDGEYDADFLRCVAFGNQANFISSYVRRGNLVSVEGRIQTSNSTDEFGVRKYYTDIYVNQINALEKLEKTDDSEGISQDELNYLDQNELDGLPF